MSTNDEVNVQLTADLGNHVLAENHACSSEIWQELFLVWPFNNFTSGLARCLVFHFQDQPTEDQAQVLGCGCRSQVLGVGDCAVGPGFESSGESLRACLNFWEMISQNQM